MIVHGFSGLGSAARMGEPRMEMTAQRAARRIVAGKRCVYRFLPSKNDRAARKRGRRLQCF